MNTSTPIFSATSRLGGPAKLAQAIGVTAPMVYQWASGLRQVPAERCIQIERATEGAVRCEDLRPDIDWSVLRCPTPPTQAAA